MSCSCPEHDPSRVCMSCINSAKRLLTHTCDGPVTDFVIIARGTRLVAQGVSPRIAANAIIEALQEHGMLKDVPVRDVGS